MENVTAKSLIKEAKEEVTRETLKEYKVELKLKLKELQRARKVVSNIEREMEDIELKIAQDLDV